MNGRRGGYIRLSCTEHNPDVNLRPWSWIASLRTESPARIRSGHSMDRIARNLDNLCPIVAERSRNATPCVVQALPCRAKAGGTNIALADECLRLGLDMKRPHNRDRAKPCLRAWDA